jgi:hypothetical protein
MGEEGADRTMMEIVLTVPCPEHEGAFDCTPFCNVCSGEQEFEKKVMV